jgi:hypothetical protein
MPSQKDFRTTLLPISGGREGSSDGGRERECLKATNHQAIERGNHNSKVFLKSELEARTVEATNPNKRTSERMSDHTFTIT